MSTFQPKYPLRNMTDVGDWFFVPGAVGLQKYMGKRAKEIGINLAIEERTMFKVGDTWEPCGDQDAGGLRGTKVVRTA